MKIEFSVFCRMLAIVFVLFVIAGCKDDDVPTINFPEGTVTAFTTSREQGDFTIPVITTGEWKAMVVPANAYWLSLITHEGKGNARVRYIIEPNTTDEYREAQIVFTAGEQTLTYKVKQTTLSKDGEEESLNGAEIDYSLFAGSVPVGYGMRIKKKSNMREFVAGQIFNIEKLEDKLLGKYLTGTYVNTKDLSTDEIQLSTAKEFKEQEKSIKANLSVNIAYGMFKLGLKGAFNLYGGSIDTTFVYSAVTTAPNQSVSLSYESLLSSYEKVPDKLRALVMTNSFVEVRDSIETLVRAGKALGDYDLEEQLGDLNNIFGPVFCAGVTMGANANVSVSMGKSMAKDTLAVSGTLSATISSLFSLNAEASAFYLNQSSSYMENSKIDIKITGGTKEGRNALIESFAKLTDPKTETTVINSLLIKNIAAWSNTIDPNKKETFTCTEYSLIGIWELFKNRKTQAVVKEYLTDIYHNKQDEKGNSYSPYLVDIETMVSE